MANFPALAIKLINKSGRVVKLKKLSTTPADANKPWRGADETTVEADEEETKAVFVSLSDQNFANLGIKIDPENRTEQIALLAPEFDVSAFGLIEDAGVNWNIVKLHTLKPGNDVCLYMAEVKQ